MNPSEAKEKGRDEAEMNSDPSIDLNLIRPIILPYLLYLPYRERILSAYTCRDWYQTLRGVRGGEGPGKGKAFDEEAERDLIEHGHTGLFSAQPIEVRETYKFTYPWGTIPLLFNSSFISSASDGGEEETMMADRMVWLLGLDRSHPGWGSPYDRYARYSIPESFPLQADPILRGPTILQRARSLIRLIERAPAERIRMVIRVIYLSDLESKMGPIDPQVGDAGSALRLGFIAWIISASSRLFVRSPDSDSDSDSDSAADKEVRGWRALLDERSRSPQPYLVDLIHTFDMLGRTDLLRQLHETSSDSESEIQFALSNHLPYRRNLIKLTLLRNALRCYLALRRAGGRVEPEVYPPPRSDDQILKDLYPSGWSDVGGIEEVTDDEIDSDTDPEIQGEFQPEDAAQESDGEWVPVTSIGE